MDSISSLTQQNLGVLRQVMSEIPVACFMLDKEHRVVVWNRGCEQATGYPAARMLGSCEAWRAFYPEKRPVLADLVVDGVILQQLQTYYAGQVRMSSLFEGVVEIEAFFPLIGKGGRWLYATVAPVRSPEGEIIGALEILQDVDTLRLAEQRTRALLDATPEAMLVVDAKGRIIMANPLSETTFGYAVSELVGRAVEQLLPARFRSDHVAQRQGFFDAERSIPGYRMAAGRPLLAVRKDGTEFPAEIGLNRVQVGGENVVVCSIRDVTVQRRVQQELREAKEMAEAATRAKSEFLANMSHEIRTPMHAIIGLTKLALLGQLPEQEREYLRKAHGAAEALLGILNDILDFSKIEAGKLSIDYTPIDLGELLEGLIETHGHQAREKGLFLTLDMAPEVPRMIESDPLRLRQVLGNLCSNAIKFTERGGVSISATLENDGKNARLVLVIADTGIGLCPEQLARLFQSFSQADSSTTRKYGGSGLGLAIAKRLLALMGGDIRLESEPDVGTRVHVFLPLSETLLPNLHLAGKRILVVDDHELSRAQMDSMCRWFGMLPTTVSSALEARMELRKAMLDGAPYDIALVDWLMPAEDGLTCVRRMSQEFGTATPAIVLVTSASREEARYAIHESGLALHHLINKPLHIRKLGEVLSQALAGELEEDAGGSIADQMAALRGARILLVDDNDLNREVACEWLRMLDVLIIQAEHGQAALDRLAAESVDAVLMDCQMPVMDGYEATRRIRLNPAWKNLPIIALSANAMDSDVQDALAAGMNDYLSKPLQEERLYGTLAKWLLRSGPRPAPSGGEASAPAVPPASPTDILDIPGLNTAQGLRAANHKPDLYRLVLGKFVQGQKDLAETLPRALGADDWNTAMRLAHTLRSGAGYIGAEALAREAGELELLLRRKAPRAEVDGRLQTVLPMLAALREQIVQTLRGVDAADK